MHNRKNRRLAAIMVVALAVMSVSMACGVFFPALTRTESEAPEPVETAILVPEVSAPPVQLEQGSLGRRMKMTLAIGDRLVPVQLYGPLDVDQYVDAEVEVRSAGRTRHLPVDRFILGNRRTALGVFALGDGVHAIQLVHGVVHDLAVRR